MTICASSALLLACGDSRDAPILDREPAREELEAVWREAEPIIDDELAKEEARSAVQFPCTLYDKEAVNALLHAELEAPQFAHVYQSLNEDGWQSNACSWNHWDSGPSLNVWVSRPNQFGDRGVQCFGMEDVQIEQAHGGRALWMFVEGFAWARLLVCREDALFEVEVHRGPKDEPEARALTDRVARDVIAAL